MPASTQQPPRSRTNVERRFYPRVSPKSPIFVAFDKNEPETSQLLNVSENGLLVSTTASLKCNHVARLSIPLNGLPKPVQVTARVAWTTEETNRAGIQLLDLSEHDRQQIRKWGAGESPQSKQPEPDSDYLPPAVPFFPTSSPAPQTAASFAEDDSPSSMLRGIDSLAPSFAASRRLARSSSLRTRLASIVSTRTMRVALVAATGFAVTILLIKAGTINPFAGSRESREESFSAPVSNTVPPVPENPDTSEVAPIAPQTPPLPPVNPTKEKSSHPSAPLERSSQQVERATAAPGVASIGSASPHATPQNPLAESPAQARPSLTPAQPANPSAPASENVRATQTAPSGATPVPTPASAPGETTNAPAVAPTPAPSISRAQPTPNQPAPNPARSIDVPTAASSSPTTPPSGPIVASTRPAAPINSAPTIQRAMQPAIQPVIQMDAPPNQTLEVHLPSGYRGPFFSLPGERVLETPTVTMHIQRYVHIPATHVWSVTHNKVWPFNHNKKIVVGELISRVDPQPTQVAANASASAASVRVKATISKDGRIENVDQVLGSPGLAPVAAKALYEWRYQPTLVDNKPVETLCYVTFQFHAPPQGAAKR